MTVWTYCVFRSKYLLTSATMQSAESMSDQFITIRTKNKRRAPYATPANNSNTKNGSVSAPRDRFVVINKAKVCTPQSPEARPQPMAVKKSAPIKADKNPPKAGIWTNEQI